MVDIYFDTKKFENKLAIFSAGLGSFYNELLEDVGKRMTSEARARAPADTGKLRSSVNFILGRGRTSALSTRERFGEDTVRYAWAREHGSTVKPKDGKEFMTFKIGGQWVRLRSFRSEPQPFMIPTYNSFWKGSAARGYREMANALQRRMREELS